MFKKISFWHQGLLVLFFMLYFGLTTFSQNPKAVQNSIKITPEQLQKMPFKKFIQANVDYEIERCNVSMNAENGAKDKIEEFDVKEGQMPAALKQRFAHVNNGDIIIIDSRQAVVNGEMKKLPAVVYYVESKS